MNVYMEGGARRRKGRGRKGKGWGCRSEVGHFVPMNSFWIARECRREERTRIYTISKDTFKRVIDLTVNKNY